MTGDSSTKLATPPTLLAAVAGIARSWCR